MAAAVGNSRNTQVSLGQRAPVAPIATWTWYAYARYGLGLIEYTSILGQHNRCIRSRVGHVSIGNKFSLLARPRDRFVEAEVDVITQSFPYPPAFKRLLTEEDGSDVPIQGQTRSTFAGSQTVMSEFGFLGLWGVRGISFVEYNTKIQPVYLVVGIFSRGNPHPLERIVFADKPERLFKELSWAIFRLRGLSGTFFSLRYVKKFRLYQCDVETGAHERIELDSHGVADLELLLHTYKRWHVPDYITQKWARWIHETLNNDSLDVVKGSLALEIVLGWSMTRIAIVVLLPVLLSLAIGLWLNAKAWTDLTTIQTAWGTASYIATAGGFVAALLGILSSISAK
ncbi:hypothetical protein B0T10DRAFT_531399 [Thelonectria olida]|uniref:Uncharacterized protein n=1 Tax=Thelonectria olida TaxID=1576542 RepID=A0A9P8VXT9_9HYPO|nr:hypothetical protein B0T10DRAFT_531399 [Thelonectria olida]